MQTGRRELADDEAFKEDKTRLLLRGEMKKHNKNLAGVAKQAGVIQPVDYASIIPQVLRLLQSQAHQFFGRDLGQVPRAAGQQGKQRPEWRP